MAPYFMRISPADSAIDAVRLLQGLRAVYKSFACPSAEDKLAHTALSRLSLNRQGILVLRYLDDWSISRIAFVKGLDERVVSQACDAALRAFCIALRKCSARIDAKPMKAPPAATSFPQNGQPGDDRTRMRQVRGSGVTSRARPKTIGANEIPASLLEGPLTKEKCFALLQVSPSDSYEIRRKAYLRMMKQYHPDVVFTAGLVARKRAEDLSKWINLAWEMVGAEGSVA